MAKKMGKPKKELTKEQIKMLPKLMAFGFDIKRVSSLFDVTDVTLSRILKEQLKTSWNELKKDATTELTMNVIAHLFMQSEMGSTTASKHLLELLNYYSQEQRLFYVRQSEKHKADMKLAKEKTKELELKNKTASAIIDNGESLGEELEAYKEVMKMWKD